MHNPFNEQMQNVRRNLETLHTRLLSLGFKFSDSESSLLGPTTDVEEHIRFLEENIGAVPPALASFYRVVGSVNFTGMHPQWRGCEYPDPIVVEPVENATLEAKEYLKLESPAEYWASENGKFRIPIAPDYYHKENVSGGMWYGVEVPNEKDDPELLEEWHHTTFVRYLRLCFEWGGFPGVARATGIHTWPIEKLSAGLVAI